MLSTELKQTINAAIADTQRRRHEYITLEHLLLALLDDPSARKIILACQGDVEKIRAELETFIEQNTEVLPDKPAGTDKTPTDKTKGATPPPPTGGAGAPTATGGDAGATAEADDDAEAAEVKCFGINECSGQSKCDVAGSHECGGQNSCKGKGWIVVPQSECDSKGGKVL